MVLVMLQGKLLHGNLMQSYENYTSLNVTVRDIEFIENQMRVFASNPSSALSFLFHSPFLDSTTFNLMVISITP